MKTKLVLGIVVVVIVVAAALAWNARRDAGSEAEFHAVGPYSVSARNEPTPPRTGENVLVVVVEDGQGKRVRGLALAPLISMPAMGAMPYMESRGRVTESPAGTYRVAYGLAMSGEWDVLLRLTAPGAEMAEGRWRLSTRLPEIAFAGGEAGPDSAQAPGTLVLDAARRQAIGVKTARAEARDFVVPIRARGSVVFDETARAVVSMRYPGWVKTIAADFTGKAVRRGEPLFTVDSPEINAAQQEYLAALRFARSDSTSHEVAFGDAARNAPTLSLADAARQRLLAWGVEPDQVATIARTGRPFTNLVVRSPVSGVVVEKSIVAGSPFTPGQVLMSIARVDPAWIEARVYEADLPLIRTGMPARVASPYDPRGTRTGRVTFVAPALDPASRTGVARIELPNPGGALKPGMFVDVTLDAALGQRLVVPEGAVVATGTRQIVFVDLGGGRLEPREVTVGPKSGTWIAIERGLTAGETVVTSGNFLVAADARLRSALARW
jgi:Cu(I)/Ag(I) efflux system membrane fusion protein